MLPPIYDIAIYLLLLSISPSHSDLHQCSTQGQCESQTITCAEGEACYVECSANWACRNAIIKCPMGHDCNIKCYYDNPEFNITEYGQQICMQMTINATTSSQLIINASIGNTPYFPYPRTLQSAKIHCPVDNNNNNNNIEDTIPNGDGKPCRIYCDGDDLMQRVIINAMEGMNDLHIEAINHAKRWCIRGAKLNCGEQYHINCSLTNTPPFGCQDPLSFTVDQRCETYVVGTTTSSSTSTSSPITTTSSIITSSTTESTTETEPTETIETPAPITHIPTASPTRSPTPGKGDSNEHNIGTETTPLSDEMSANNGLTDGEMVIVILIPLFFCALILIGIGCYMMKKRDNYDDTDTYNKRKRNQVKEVYDDDMEEEDDEDEDDGHEPLRTGSTDSAIDIGYDETRNNETNPEIYGKDKKKKGKIKIKIEK